MVVCPLKHWIRFVVIGLALVGSVRAGEPEDPKVKAWISNLEKAQKEVKAAGAPNPEECPTCVVSANPSPTPEAIEPPGYERAHALSMFVLFPSLKTHAAKKNSISVSMNTGNVWTPTIYVMPKAKSGGDVYFVCPDGDCPIIDDLNGETPLRFEGMTEEEFRKNAKVFHADGVVRQFKVDLDRALAKNQSISLQVGLTQLVGGKDGLGPSDHFIEWFHTEILGPNNVDPFSRGKHPYEQAEIYFRDGEGKEHRLKAGDLAGTLKLEYVKSIDFYSLDKKRILSLNFGAMAGGALGAKGREFNPDIQLGASLSGAWSKLYTKRRTLTVGAGVSATKVDAIRTGRTAPNMGLSKHREEFQFFLAGSKTNRKGTLKTTVGGEVEIHSVLLNSDDYTFKYPATKESDVAAGSGPYRGSTTIKQYFLSPNIMMQPFVRFELLKYGASVEIWGSEDSSPTNNSEDLNWGVKVKKDLGKKHPRKPAGG